MPHSQKGVKGFVSDNSEGAINTETEAWNIAKGYTSIKILRLLVLLDRDEAIAIFGTEDIDQEVVIPDVNTLAQRRIEGINRYVFHLSQLIGNVKFAIKKPDRKIIEYIEERLKNVVNVLNGVSSINQNEVSHEITIIINEEHLTLCLKTLKKLKDELNTPINNASLIFKSSEEMDIEAIMNEIVEGG